MKNLRSLVLCIVGIGLFNHYSSFAEAVGSSTTVSMITNSPVFPARDNDNIMLEFGYFQGGFTLQDASTTCTFNSIFPVSGYLNMNGGTLYLAENIILVEPVHIAGLGAIIGNNHSLEFCSSVTLLPTNFTIMKDIKLIFNHDVEFNSMVTVQGNCSIQCAGSKITLNNGAGFILASGAHLEIQDAKLENVGTSGNSTNVSCADNTSQLTLNNTTVALASDWTFAAGSLRVKNLSAITGPYNLYYTSGVSSVIEAYATLLLDNGLEFIFGKASSSSPEPLVLAKRSSILECKECTLHITASGAQLTCGKINFDGYVAIETDSTDTLCGLILGDHVTAANDVEIFFGPGCIVNMRQGSLTYNNIKGDGFLNSTPSSIFAMSTDATLHLTSSCTLPNNNFVINYNGSSLPTLLLDQGVMLYLEDTHVTIPGVGETIYHGFFQYPYSFSLFFLDTNNSIYLANGSLSIATKVLGSSNKIRGNGFISSQLTMDNDASSAVLTLQGSIDSPVSLNGGTLTLTADTEFTAANCFVTTGTIDLGVKTLTLQTVSACEYSVPVYWTGNGGDVEITQDITLTSTWTFKGNITIDANGNAIIFEGGSIAVAPGSNIIIKNARLNSVVQDSISCKDDTSSITLYNVTWEQESNVVYSHGGLNYKGSVLMTGPGYQFAYASTVTSTFYKDTTLALDNQFTFSYSPSNNATTLLQFTDYTSKLMLTHAIFYCVPGVKLTKGQMILLQYPTLYALGDGMTVGDMTVTDSSADMQLMFMDSGYTSFKAGSMKYQNLKNTSCQMWAGAGLEFADYADLYLYRTITLNNGIILFGMHNKLYYYGSACPVASGVDGSMSGYMDWVDMCV